MYIEENMEILYSDKKLNEKFTKNCKHTRDISCLLQSKNEDQRRLTFVNNIMTYFENKLIIDRRRKRFK